jgi:HNH endonuclease
MALSVRTRFEVFKRDEFRCQYCGRKSPGIVLEIDHIVPLCDGGTDDPINLIASCWDCNHGKAGVPLQEVLTGEDPHDRAVMLLERQRQLEEYNNVLAAEHERRSDDCWELIRYWQFHLGEIKADTPEDDLRCNRQDSSWLMSALQWCPKEQIRRFMDIAVGRGMTKNFRYVAGCARNWRYEMQATKDMQQRKIDDPYGDA